MKNYKVKLIDARCTTRVAIFTIKAINKTEAAGIALQKVPFNFIVGDVTEIRE
jgi:hypothetical protein